MGSNDIIEIMHIEVDFVARELVSHIIKINKRKINNLGYSD